MSSRDRSLIALATLVIAALIGYFAVVAPAHRHANRLEDEIATARQSLASAEAQVQAGQRAEAQYRVYAGQLSSITRAVPEDDQIPQLINELQAASTHSHVGFQSVSVGAGSVAAASGTTAATFPSQSFSLTFTGGYFAVANLLGRLADFVHTDDQRFSASGRLITISSVSLTPGATGTSTTTGGAVTAAVSAVDYDVPSSLIGGSSTTTSAG